jgi:ubiquinone/menaquinone biosynthesis C-methylase UbiE
MKNKPGRLCPVERAGTLDSKIRRWFQDPLKIMKPYLKPGMTVLDFGCGPGFFTLDMAQMVGASGRVIAVDLQQGMLEKVHTKIQGTDLENRIRLHQCEENKINLAEPIDFFFSFYVMHEVPDQEVLFREISRMLKPDGAVFIAEPPVHVSRKAFEVTLDLARENGLRLAERPRVFLSKAAVLTKTLG